jgi:hypothetical protein
MLFLVKNSLLKRKQQPALLTPEFGAKSSHIFTQSPQNVTVVCGIDCSTCQDEFFVKNHLDIKQSDEHALDFSLHLPHILRSSLKPSMPLTHSHTAHAFFPIACLIIARVSALLSARFTQK